MMKGGRILTSVESTSDKNFLDSVYGFIENEKKHLPCNENGEQRYIIYSAAFDMVIEHTTVYKVVLAAIKREYDNLIRAVKKRHHEARRLQGRLKSALSEPVSLMNYHRRSAQLLERIAVIRKDTSELQTELSRLRTLQTEKRPAHEGQDIPSCQDARTFVQNPGLTLKEMMSRGALLGLKQKRPEPPSRKANRPKAELGGRMSVETLREELLRENKKGSLRNKQLKAINDSLRSWEKSGREPQLMDFLPSVLCKPSESKGRDPDTESIMSALFRRDDSGAWLQEEFNRFKEGLFRGDNEDASSPGARSPQGPRRDVETVGRIRAEGGMSPLFLAIRSSMAAVHAGMRLPTAELSVAMVKYALEHSCLEMVTHWVTQKKLTCSEALGDVICSYRCAGQQVADTCLTLAQLVYEACGVRAKAAACLCSRGMTHTAMVQQDAAFSLDDCLYLLKSYPSLALIQGLTTAHHGRPAVLSPGLVAHTLLASGREQLAVQLLESIRSRAPVPFGNLIGEAVLPIHCHPESGALDGAILADVGCTPEGWGEIAECCKQQDRFQLAQEILTVLTSQDGTVLLSPDPEGAKLMEHVFM